MDDLNEKLSSVLSDPQSLEAILNVVKGLSSKKEEPVSETKETAVQDTSFANITNVIKENPREKDSERINLLLSLRPFLREEKKDRVDGLVKAIKTAQLINTYKNTDILKTFGLK